MKTSIPLLRRIRFKDGKSIEVIRNHAPSRGEVEASIRESVRDYYDTYSGFVGGYAIVIWQADGSSTARIRNYNGIVPLAITPDFVRERVNLQIMKDWVDRDH